MNFTKDTPREEIERIIRETVYREMNLPLPRRAEGPNPLVVNVSARHAHLTKEAVEILFGKGYELTVHKWLYQKGQFAAKESVTLIGPRSRVISNLRILGPCRSACQVELALTDARARGGEASFKKNKYLKFKKGKTSWQMQ